LIVELNELIRGWVRVIFPAMSERLWVWAFFPCFNWRSRVAALLLTPLVFPCGSLGDILPPGQRPKPLGVHALAGARIVTGPGELLETGTVVIRNGIIAAVGEDVEVPSDARVWERQGHTIYAGFIDPYLVAGGGGGGENHPTESEVIELGAGVTGFLGIAGQPEGRRGPGHELSTVTPENQALQHYRPDAALLKSLRKAGFTVGLAVPQNGIARGSSALVTLSDDRPNDVILKEEVFQHVVFAPNTSRRVYPASLMGVMAVVRQAFLDAGHYKLDWEDYQGRPGERARPAYNRSLEALQPVLDGRTPVLFEPRDVFMAPAALQIARESGFDFILLGTGEEWRRAELILETGAPIILPLNFPEIPRLPQETDWLEIRLDDLRAWDWAPENAALLSSQGIEIALTTHGLSDRNKFRRNLKKALERGLSEEVALAALTVLPARLCGMEERLGTIAPGKLANLTVVKGLSYFDPEAPVAEVWIDGRIFPSEPERPGRRSTSTRESPSARGENEPPREEKEKAAEEKEKEGSERIARFPVEDRGALAEPQVVLIENATIWTCAAEGRLEKASLLCADGVIVLVTTEKVRREDYPYEGEWQVMDGTGLHVTPGLIDAHSHSMILGGLRGVNEGTLPSTAMVRIADVIDSETENFYQQLAGGLTVANLLHGSANPIGGQNAVIKLKFGEPASKLLISDAPAGIKFALGENVKQAYAPQATGRFPQTRMGVRTFYLNRFAAAQQYLENWQRYHSEGGPPPRRDLELEALGEILEGQRWIHCHSYRQDEILMFLRLMESLEVRIATFQHVLEGYKVADELAAHGVGASAFSDWWGFKFEAYDAIPYAGSLMRQRGVSVSFNSDSSDLARRMHLEAAKGVKYGGTPEIEALNFVTINPARQLGIDHRAGSLEPGKDADFVLWSGSPLDSFSVCLETWIEGKKYFDRELDLERTERRRQEWEALVEKAKGTRASPATDEKKTDPPEEDLSERLLQLLYHEHRQCQCDHE
jgi:imidazolonepropionase-like amidohydrolase